MSDEAIAFTRVKLTFRDINAAEANIASIHECWCAPKRMLIFFIAMDSRCVLTDGLKRCHLFRHDEKRIRISDRKSYFKQIPAIAPPFTAIAIIRHPVVVLRRLV